MKRKHSALLLCLGIFGLAAVPTKAAVVFSDDFESPDVTTAQSTGNTSGAITTSKWVRATNGFGATRQGTVDESAGAFTDPVGQQAYAFRYTNSGITSAFNTIGALTVGTTITVSFDVVMDTNALPYSVGLVTFNGTGTRNSLNSLGMIEGTTSLLASTAGNALSDGSYKTVTFSYTVGSNVVDNNGAASGVATAWLPSLLGQDIALRFIGATTSANIDNVSVAITAVPEPRAALLGGLGLLILLRRRRS